MRIRRRVIAFAIGALALAASADPGGSQSNPTRAFPGGVHNEARLFALSPIYTVAPDARIQELKSGEVGLLRTRNGAFDGRRDTLLFFGAQHQEVAVQIVVPT